jgi:phosphonate transport system permease protein
VTDCSRSLKPWGRLGAEDDAGQDDKPPARPPDRAVIVITITLLVLGGLTIYCLLTMDYGGVDVPRAVSTTISNFGLILFQPGSHRFGVLDALLGIVITVGLAFLTTLLGAAVAFILGLMGAENLSPKWLVKAVRAFVAFIRAVPTILWVLIFAVASGLGSTAAVLGLSFHSIGYLTKAYAESFEDLDKRVIEALKATGANWWQIVFQAVLPSSATYLLSWTFLRFEINFGNAVAMGAAAGAAGIGFDLFMASGFYFDLREVGMITYFILGFAIIIETIATRFKAKLKKG